MKKLLLILAVVAMMLPSCKKINEALDSLDDRLNKLEQEAIPSIDEQISAINTTLGNLDAMDKELKGYIDNLTTTASNLQEQINTTNTKIDEVKSALQGEISTAKANVIAQLEAAKEELEEELKKINTAIGILQAKDTELEGKITELRTYVDTELGKTTDWVNATFATLSQYNDLVAEIATIKEQIKAINQSIADLETRLITKINEDIATAVSTLNADIQQKVSEITTAYTNAIKTAKEEITAAYTAAIQNAINALDTSLKAWVGEQLANYYTIAEVDALLAALELEMNGKLEAQKAYLESLINELSTSLTKSIADNKVLIEGLQKDITTVQGTVAEHASRIAQNASTIATNTQNIIDLSKAIYTNKDNISANEKAIASNKALIEVNSKLIAENKSAIDALKNSTTTKITENATAIAKNAEDIAQNAALISANAIAINNNAAAIADNATDILQLQQNLVATKTEITEAYQKAINDAIATNNGVVDTKIAAQVQTINTRIDNEVATINSAIATLTSRIAAVENEIATIQQQIAAILEDIEDIKEDIARLLARIQSVSYIPTYSDGKATVKYYSNISQVTLDFEVSPKDAVAELAKVWKNALSVKAIYTQTRAVSFIEMPIAKFEADATNGIITIIASGKNLSEEFFAGTQEASCRLAIFDGNNSVTSEYIPMVAKFVTAEEIGTIPSDEIWYTSSGGKVITPRKTDVFGANIVSNTYENGKGVIKFDAPVTSIGDDAFSGYSWLTSVTIPDSITSIGNGAFSGCVGLTNITSLDRVTSIGDQAFGGCESLTSVTIPDSVTSIGSRVFSDCISLKAFYGKFASSDNRCLIVDGVLDSFAPSGLTTYTIPDGITSIGRNAFAFLYLMSLTSITIPDSVTSIGDYAFSRCTSLTSVTIPNSVTSIGEYAFYNCTSLTSVVIGNSVTSIGYEAFAYCRSLTSVYCKATTPPTGASYMFSDNASGRKIYVPTASVDAYKSASYWSSYASYIEGYVF